MFYFILILSSSYPSVFDCLASFHLELLQAILFTVELYYIILYYIILYYIILYYIILYYIILYYIILYYHCVTIAYSIQYSNMLYRFVA